ncbi:MAG TPA: serine/threonine-protein kinase, partial [Polyangium sp.]|nr:serine/threonine-protein kinase [Polyangium sp.]
MAERDSTSDASNDPTKTALEAPNSLSLPTKMRFANGTTLGHYEVLEPLGQGGMGEVYLARDTRLGRRVALKFLTHVTSTQSARFFVEARATAQLAHENIVSLYDIAEHEGLPYMVLEYVPGKTLSTWLRERRHGDFFDPVLPIQAAEMMLPVVRALQCAHEAGIVHRDLKPANIMLAKSGTVKVLDFGVAKLIATAQPGVEGDAPLENPESWVKQATTAADLTETGAMVGTRSYMAPEQWWGDEVDGRTDIWAVGIMMYIMVVGDHPLAPLTPSSIVHVAERHLPMPRIADVMPTLGELGSIIDRCLRKDMDERWSCARELAEALDRFIRAST